MTLTFQQHLLINETFRKYVAACEQLEEEALDELETVHGIDRQELESLWDWL